METLRLPATAESREVFRRFVVAEATAAGMAPSLLLKLELVLEELLVNHTNHAYREGAGDSEVTCFPSGPGVFCLKLVDHGPPFNPLVQPEPDLLEEVEQRPIGGLGLHLVRRLVSQLAYQRTEHENIVTVCFPIQPAATTASAPGA